MIFTITLICLGRRVEFEFKAKILFNEDNSYDLCLLNLDIQSAGRAQENSKIEAKSFGMSYDVLLNGKQEKQYLFVKWFRVKTGISCFLLDVCFHKSLLFINATKATGVKCTWFLALTIMFGRVLYGH